LEWRLLGYCQCSKTNTSQVPEQQHLLLVLVLVLLALVQLLLMLCQL
jgi:hypothetical protein